MSLDAITIANSSPINGLFSSSQSKLNELYSTFETHSSSRSSSIDSSPSCLLNKHCPEAQTSISSTHRKDSSIKVPYPVLSDHRDPSSVLDLLQKETQITSKKILDVIQQVEDCEKRLTSNLLSDNNKKSLKYERVKLKQQLDGLKKHERRVNLQIDFITTKTEIKGLVEEQQQIVPKKNTDENHQIEVLLGKLKQKLDKMKIYMRSRNEQMKKINNGKQRSSTSNDNRKQLSSSQKPQQRLSSSDLNRKRLPSSTNNLHSNKRLKSSTYNHNKPPPSVVRPTSRLTSHQTKSRSIQPPIVRFLNKTTESAISSLSPTTPASSSSTLSPPLIASTSTGDANHIQRSLLKNELPSVDEDNDLDLELDMDELFNDDLYSQPTGHKLKVKMNE